MKSSNIKLSLKIKLANNSDAQTFGLSQQFDAYIQGLKGIFDLYKYNTFSKLSNFLKCEIEEMQEARCSRSFLNTLKENNPLTDINNLCKLDIDKVFLKIVEYDNESGFLNLNVFCISKELLLIDTIGNFMLIKNGDDDSEWSKIFTISLTHDISIYEIKL